MDSFALEKDLAPNTYARLMRKAARGDLSGVETARQGMKPYRASEFHTLTNEVMAGGWDVDTDGDGDDDETLRPRPSITDARASWAAAIAAANEQAPAGLRTVDIVDRPCRPHMLIPSWVIPTSDGWQKAADRVN